MNNRERESMNEKDLEIMLKKSISSFPPEDVVAGVTPWKKAMNRALIGMAFYVRTFCRGSGWLEHQQLVQLYPSKKLAPISGCNSHRNVYEK